MKLLIFLLCILTGLALLVSGAVFLGAGSSEVWHIAGITMGTWNYIQLCLLNFCLFSGLVLSVTGMLSGAAMTLLSFIFKSWIRAAIAIGCTGMNVLLWAFLLDCKI